MSLLQRQLRYKRSILYIHTASYRELYLLHAAQQLKRYSIQLSSPNKRLGALLALQFITPQTLLHTRTALMTLVTPQHT